MRDCPEGTATDRFISLQDVNDKLTGPITQNWVIYVHSGTYWDASVVWTKTDPAHTVEIRAPGSDKPVFDGRSSDSDPTGGAKFFGLNASGPSNLTLRGLTIQHYHKHGVTLHNCAQTNSYGDCLDAASGNNSIINNVFQYIGSREDPDLCEHGYSVIGIDSSKDNTVSGNQFVHIENVSELQYNCDCVPFENDFELIHVVYLSDRASNNLIKDNFIDLCTGAPFKVRNRSNNNIFRRNYVNRAGTDHVLNAWHAKPSDADDDVDECFSHGNQLIDNVITFPYPAKPALVENVRKLELCGGSPAERTSCSTTELLENCEGVPEVFVQFTSTNNYIYKVEPESELVRAIATANTTSTSTQEVFLAFEYESSDPEAPPLFTKIVSTGRTPWLSELVSYSTSRSVTAMTGGNFDGIGNPELVTAFDESGTTKVYRGSGVQVLPGVTGATDLGLVYQDAVWDVKALAAGDLDANGSDELFTGLVRSCCKRIYRGNGTTSLTTYGNLLDTGEVPVALAVGNFDGVGAPELVSALETSSPYSVRIARGTGIGTGGATNLSEPYPANTWWHVRSMAGQDGERDGDVELQTGFHGLNLTRISRGNGTTTAATTTIYESSNGYWTVPALARRTGPSSDELVCGFQAWDAEETQVWSGDGVTSATSVASHYASIFNGADDPEVVPDRQCKQVPLGCEPVDPPDCP